MKMTGHVKLQQGNKTWAEASTENGTIIVETNHPLYSNLLALAGTGISDVKTGKPFDILVARFREYEIDLIPYQVVAYESQH